MCASVEAAKLRPIGYYVHHQGRGHATRAQLLIRQLERSVTVFTSAPHYFAPDCEANVVELPSDYEAPDAQAEVALPSSPVMHYAPLGVAGLRQRMATMAQWVAKHDPAYVIVDVSVEVALLMRGLGVPTVVTKLQGDRSDLPHQIAFQHASAILCPYPAAWEQFALPSSQRQKCIYTGAYSRFLGRQPFGKTIPGRILVCMGSGGSQLTIDRLCTLAEALPNHTVEVLGSIDVESGFSLPQNLSYVGAVLDPWPHLCEAEVVIAGAGTNAVMEVGSAGKPLICVPEQRAFDEQLTKARALADAGLALRCEHWPSAAAWPRVLAKAEQLSPSRWQSYFTDPTLSAVAARVEHDCTGGFSNLSRLPQMLARLPVE